MKWKKLVTLGCVVVMTVSSVTACGSNTTENQTVEATEQSEENQSDSVIVQVTAVDGDQITADVGTLTTASADASGNGAPGEKHRAETHRAEKHRAETTVETERRAEKHRVETHRAETTVETERRAEKHQAEKRRAEKRQVEMHRAVRCRAAAVLRLPVRALPLP